MKLSCAASKTQTELEFHLFIFARCLCVCFGFYTLLLLLFPLLLLLMMISFFLRSFGSLCMFYVLQITSVRVSYYIFPIFHLHSYYITNFTHFSSKFISNYDDHCTHHIYLCIRLFFSAKIPCLVQKRFKLALLYDVWLTISVRRITIEKEMKMEMEIEKEGESDNTKQIFLAIIFICLVLEKQHKKK